MQWTLEENVAEAEVNAETETRNWERKKPQVTHRDGPLRTHSCRARIPPVPHELHRGCRAPSWKIRFGAWRRWIGGFCVCKWKHQNNIHLSRFEQKPPILFSFKWFLDWEIVKIPFGCLVQCFIYKKSSSSHKWHALS